MRSRQTRSMGVQVIVVAAAAITVAGCAVGRSTVTKTTTQTTTQTVTETATAPTTTQPTSGQTGSYPPDVRAALYDGCREGGGTQSQCTCVVNAFEKAVPVEKLKTLTQAEIERVAAACM